MGTFAWPLRISNMNGGVSREIEVTVDPDDRDGPTTI